MVLTGYDDYFFSLTGTCPTTPTVVVEEQEAEDYLASTDNVGRIIYYEGTPTAQLPRDGYYVIKNASSSSNNGNVTVTE